MKWGRTRLTGAALGAGIFLMAPSLAHATFGVKAFSVPGQHAFVVPPAVGTLLVSAVGGHGGTGSDGVVGGAGATVTAVLAVHPGQVLYVEVGGNGQPGLNIAQGSAGGFNGGGPGGSEVVLFAGTPSGGGGGGASDIRTVPMCPAAHPTCGSLASRLIVASGGGGGGGTSAYAAGGIGGASDADGLPGNADLQADQAGTGGRRGTLIAGGPAGSPGESSPGTLGQGGQGASNIGGAGGGGGGGIFGGGGGGGGNGQFIDNDTVIVSSGGGGGGGGSSSQPPGPKGVTNLTLRPTASGAQPRVTLAWKLPRPTVRALAPTLVRPTTATLHGTLNPNAAPLGNCHFTISPASLIGSAIPCAQQVHAVTVPVPVSARVAGLRPATRYTVRLVGVNAQGLARSAPITFTTPRRRHH